MVKFDYEAMDAQGKRLAGVVIAHDEREAMRNLQKQGLLVTQVARHAAAKRRHATRRRLQKREILLALHELTTMLESGVSIAESVQAMAESAHHPELAAKFELMSNRLRQGSGFSAALAEGSLALPEYMMQLVHAGELTGQLPESLRSGLEQMEYDQKVAGELRNALIYPSVLVVSGVLAVLLIFVFVVPKFSGLLAKTDREIPWLGKTVLTLGTWVNAHWWLVALVAGALLFLGSTALRRPDTRRALTNACARLPILGEWLGEAETARWAAVLGTLLGHRVPLLSALELAQGGVRLPMRQQRMGLVVKAVRAGQALSEALHEHDALSPTGCNLVRVGEKSGQMPRMLTSLARLYDESARNRMARVLLLIEPVAILLIGAIIGVIILGVVQAITSVNEIAL